jgi:Na+-transporting NADH:ubiquinone oxidoreductase subunit NqrA
MGAAVRRGLIGVLLSWAKAIPSTTEVSGRAWTSLRQRYLDQVRRVSSQPGEVYIRAPRVTPAQPNPWVLPRATPHAHGRNAGQATRTAS